ncbi:MAG TPA: ribokinase [Rhodanobacteraceae bacterium]|nr:ribokinase [Rhodanobacteraceae bacterium]
MNSTMPQVIVVGSYNRDHVWRVDRFPKEGETRLGRTFSTDPGGKGFNQAIACHRQGAQTLFVGAIGNDELGARAQQDARDESLPCRWQTLEDHPTASTAVWVDDEGNNCIVVNPGANAHLDSAFIRAQRDAFANAKLLLVQLETGLEAIEAAMNLARDRGLFRALNPAPVHPQLTLTLLRAADLITPNETEFAQLCGRFLDVDVDANALVAMSDATLHALARRLSPNATVVITLGANGCFVSHDEQQRRGDAASSYRLPAEKANVIDTTGAGDCFCGALAAAMLRFEGKPFADAVCHANRAAALSTERPGAASSMPRYDEVVARFGSPSD